MNLLMISGDQELINGKKGPFYYLLQEFSKYWNRIDVICPSKNFKNLHKNFFNNVNAYDCGRNLQAIIKKAEDIHQQSKFSLMTVHDYPPFLHSRAAQVIKERLKIPFILEIHHIVGYPKVADLKELFLKIYFKVFFKKFIKDALAIRVVNQHQVPYFLKNLGVPEEKIIYIPSFYINHEVFKPQPMDKIYDLLFVGRLVKNKGLDLLMEICQKLKKELPNYRMAIVGEGPIEDNLKSKINQAGLTNNVEFLGWLEDSEQLAKIYNQAKILLITSDNEGGPRVGLEALACGTPIISTRVGIMIDLIKEQGTGFLAEWSVEDFIDKIKLILNQPELFNRFFGKCHQVTESFEYHKLIRDYALILQNLL